jgi:hypothetical protein
MSTDPDIKVELARFSRAVRFGLASIVLGLSYPNIHCALSIKAFQDVFTSSEAGTAAGIIYGHQPLFVGLSILLPVAAVANIFMPGIVRSIYLSGVLVMAVFVQLFFQWFTMMGPISKIAG